MSRRPAAPHLSRPPDRHAVPTVGDPYEIEGDA